MKALQEKIFQLENENNDLKKSLGKINEKENEQIQAIESLKSKNDKIERENITMRYSVSNKDDELSSLKDQIAKLNQKTSQLFFENESLKKGRSCL